MKRAAPRLGSQVLLIAAALLASCARSDPAVGDCGSVRETYLFGGRLDETIELFETYDLETRYRIYICANQGVHPPMGLSPLVAEGGEASADFFAQKLETTTYDLTIHDIVVVFAMMQSMGTFDATTDPALMGLLQRKISFLEGSLRTSSERYLQTIRGGPGAPLPLPEN